MLDVPAAVRKTPTVKYQPKGSRYYFDVAVGSVCLTGGDTGGAYCLLEMALAPGIKVPRHTHTREDEAYFVLAGELEVIVADEMFVLREGDTLMAPRNIPHQLRNSGDIENHYLLVFSPSGFDEFLRVTAVPAPDNAIAPIEPPATPVRNVLELASVRVLPAGCFRCEESPERISVRLRWVFPVGPDRSPAVTETLLVGVAVLGNDSSYPLGMTEGEPEARRRAVVKDRGTCDPRSGSRATAGASAQRLVPLHDRRS
jgi:quercetin dioxygenase-like cupin family protein